MFRRHDAVNVGIRNGQWGEEVAVDYLRRAGLQVIDRNTRPVAKDARLEIDIVAWDVKRDTMTFIEVKQHATLSTCQRRLRSIDRKKRDNLRRACNAWRRINKWRGAYRFDVIEIYGTPEGGRPVIDHITDVRLFVTPERFVKWN